MDLKNKTANNLISKDIKVKSKAGLDFINNSDIEAFETIVKHSDFLFDFIKDSILKTLINSVNESNYLNLYNFTKIYSEDFSDFIIKPLLKFKDDKTDEKFLNLLESTNLNQKTYAILYFMETKNKVLASNVRNYLNSDFLPLKKASIKYLSSLNLREDYNEYINILNTTKDEFEKFEAVDFLVQYNDKSAFDLIYKTFIDSNYDDFIGSNILCLKDFGELIKEDKTEEILNLFGAIIRNFPENTSCQSLLFYLENGLFEFLCENDSNFASILILILKLKLELVLYNEEYSIDLDKKEKEALNNLFNIVSMLICNFSIHEIALFGINSKNKLENILSLEIIKELNIKSLLNEIKTMIQDISDIETIILGMEILKERNEINKEIVEKALNKTDNQTLKAQIENFI